MEILQGEIGGMLPHATRKFIAVPQDGKRSAAVRDDGAVSVSA
jgi:hypothetical protein